MKLSDAGERKIVEMITEKFSIGIDDCAIIDDGEDYILLTTDTMNKEKHFPDGSKPYYIGWYSIGVNLSDIAAKGGEPLAILSAISLPRDTEINYLQEILRGMKDCLAEYGGKLIGGDTKESSILTISITAVGRIKKDYYMARKGAKTGDGVYVTGKLGKEINLYTGDIDALLHIQPRVKEGRYLASRRVASSCMDISDGLASSLYQLMKINGVGFLIEGDNLPIYEKTMKIEKPIEFALYHGGDFELLFTMPEKYEDTLEFDFTRIGSVIKEREILMEIDGKRKKIYDRGYEHFR